MSISSRKINTMIEDEFLAKNYGAENRKLLINLSKTIYAMETSITGQSNHKKIEEIRAKIDAKSDDFIVK